MFRKNEHSEEKSYVQLAEEALPKQARVKIVMDRDALTGLAQYYATMAVYEKLDELTELLKHDRQVA